MRQRLNHQGYTLVELVIGIGVFGIIALSVYGLFEALTNSAIVAKQRAVASTIATNQMEYLKSLPYNSLAIAGGAIYSATPLPASSEEKVNGITYTVKNAINYVDDAYDGCGNYPTEQLKQRYCRNYPPPNGAPATDANPQDYKVVHVSVRDKHNHTLAEVDSHIAARVAETASTTGALFVNVIDFEGNPVSGATVNVTNTTVTPNVAASDSTDNNGTAIFYGLPPDTNNYDFVVTASNTGYSTLSTIAPNGTLQPVYPSQRIFTQQSSLLTLTIGPQGNDSIVLETTDTSGNPISGVKVYAKGGYKKYTLSTDTSYYFDNLTPTDSRPTTDAQGNGALSALAPGDYYFCGDDGTTGCSKNGTTYYLAAAIPYAGAGILQPISVPTFLASAPPTTTFPYGGKQHLQKVRLMLTTNSSYPRVKDISPNEASASSDLSAFAFTITGSNLSTGNTVSLVSGTGTYQANCSGNATSLQCTANISGATGSLQIRVTSNGNTLILPTTPLGGINVVQ